MNCKFCGKNGYVDKRKFKYRFIRESDYCIAVLAREPYNRGHTLVILKKHRCDIADKNLSLLERKDFIENIYYYSKLLKRKIKNEKGRKPGRIYVAILCDGVKHLHAHLIPRYHPFNEKEKNSYREFFINRDKYEDIKKAIKKQDMGGFWYMFLREKDYKKSYFWKKNKRQRNKERKKIIKLLNSG